MPKQAISIEWLGELLHIPKLPEHIGAVERRLAELAQSEAPGLHESFQELLRGGGKRLRPVLVIAAAVALGQPVDDNVIQTAAAIELLHLSSLVHDDIVDNADTRWGRPTISRQSGVAHALLVGDYLCASAGAAAAEVSSEVAVALDRAFAEMVEGQSLELADSHNPDRAVADYFTTIRQKTAVLIAAACQVGGCCAGAPESVIKALGAYGEAFGMAFQLVDDVLDLVAPPEESSKPVGNDLREGTYNLPILLALQGPRKAEVKQWLEHPDKINRQTIMDTLQADGSLAKTQARIEEYVSQAKQALQVLKPNPTVDGLAELPAQYVEAALQKTAIV